MSFGVSYESLTAVDLGGLGFHSGMSLTRPAESFKRMRGSWISAERSALSMFLWLRLQESSSERTLGQRVLILLTDTVTVRIAGEDGVSETVQAESLIVAAGSWAGDLMADLNLNFTLTLSQEQVNYFSSTNLSAFCPRKTSGLDLPRAE